jgi:hypothetical protein
MDRDMTLEWAKPVLLLIGLNYKMVHQLFIIF